MRLANALYRILDTETTGLEEDARIVELGACDVFQAAGPAWLQTVAAAWLCDPGIPIPPVAKAVHHIIDDDVRGKPHASEVLRDVLAAAPISEGRLVFVAHNVRYDRPILERYGMPTDARWLCTHRLAMHVWPDAPSYKNEVLRYWLGWDRLPFDGDGTLPHRAAHDAAVTALVLREAFKTRLVDDVDSLIAWAESPVVLKGQLGFGKYFDKTWAEVAQLDGGYFDWMIRQEDREPGSWDMDKIHTARHYRGRLV